MSRASAVTLAVVLLSGCGPAPLDPDRSGGVLLPGTEASPAPGSNAFSISPGGRWMLYSRPRVALDSVEQTGPGDADVELEIEVLESLLLYDLAGMAPRTIEISDAVREHLVGGSGIVWRGGCWLVSDGTVSAVVGDAFGRYVGVAPGDTPARWVVAEPDPEEVRDRCPRTSIPAPLSVGGFRFEGAGERALGIVHVDAPDRPIARHRAAVGWTGLSVREARLAPSGRTLAYVVVPNFGSFSGNPQAFLVDDDGDGTPPDPLAAPVYGMRWDPTGSHLYASAGREGRSAIYRWQVSALTPYAVDEPAVARVVENERACAVDAVCFLRLAFADTTVVAVYGTGERPAPACAIPRGVSDLAFDLHTDERIEVVVSACADEGLFVMSIQR